MPSWMPPCRRGSAVSADESPADVGSRTRSRAALRLAAGFVLVAAAVTGLSVAAFSWSTTVADGTGTECGSTWHFHPGSGYLVHGGEMTVGERRAITDQCNPAGAGPWRTGWLALAAGSALVAASTAVLVATRRSAARVGE